VKIRIESGSITTPNITGVGHYTKLLAEALAQEKNTSVQLFAFNFFNRKTQQPISGSIKTEMNYLFPLKVYAKLHSYKVAPAFDVNLTPVDLTIFPNFARWPSIKTNISATVIHDLTYIHFPDLMEAKNLAHLRRVVKQSILQSDFIITVSETIKKEIVDYFSIPSNKVIVTPIPPSVELSTKNTK
jgi:glycosyltransferase involved in cell wall biosynthesis